MSKGNDEALASQLNHISQTIRDRVIFQSTHDPDAIALWIVGTYLMDHWTSFPKLLIISPERECGKTTTLEAIEAFVFRGQMASSITAAALSRCIDKNAPTLLIDEADLTLQNNSDLQALINAGHSRRSAKRVLSVETSGNKWEPKEMSLWCPQAIAGIGEFKDTLVSRSIAIGLRRKGINEEIKYLDDKYFDEQVDHRSSLHEWASSVDPKDLLRMPPIPDGVVNRMRDNWMPLLQVAHLAGDAWVDRCSAALHELEENRKSKGSGHTGNELLQDIREALRTFTGPEIFSSDLLRLLLSSPETDWQSANRGRAINGKWLANKLRPYNIAPQRRREGNVYLMADFQDNFKRYLPSK